MSHEDSPARYADAERTPERDARESTKLLVANQSDEIGSRIADLPILSLLLYCIHRLGSPSGHEVALIVLIAMLQHGGDAFAEDFPAPPDTALALCLWQQKIRSGWPSPPALLERTAAAPTPPFRWHGP